MLTQAITLAAFVLFIPTSRPQATTDTSVFTLTNQATGICLLKKGSRCLDVRWTTGSRLFTTLTKKCLGAQGKSAGSEVSLYDCDNKTALQKWECMNGTLLSLKDQHLYIEAKSDESLTLSKTVGPNSHFAVTGTSSGACSRTYRELYTIEGNAFGKPCMFPFQYKDRWYGDCTTSDSSTRRLWCAISTKFEHEQWGYCPTASTEHWSKNLVTGSYYQLNTQSALTWAQAQASCIQQTATLVSITDPNEQAFISALLSSGKNKLWIGLALDMEHGWQWTDALPYRYLRWEAGNPLPNPGHNCAYLDIAGQHTWLSSTCAKKLGYICYKAGAPPVPPQIEQGFCAAPWIPYNGHCFHLHRTLETWTDSQKECRKEEGDLVTIRNIEDQSFVISQLGFASNDELWIGLNDRRTEKLYEWSDHSPVTFTSWTFGKPVVSTDADDCVLITGQNGNWVDRFCDEKHGFICMKQSTIESTGEEVPVDIGCKAGWKRHGSYCYLVGTETKTFDAANEDCKISGAYLADAMNGVDNAFLVSLVGLRPEKYFWIGLSNQKNIDDFVWTNTETVKFTHWNGMMPGNLQGCVAMTTGILAGLWDVLPCTNTEKYICKQLAEGAVLTVPPPTQASPKCAEGWIQVGTSKYCSKFFTGPRADEKTWQEARDYCVAIGGDLLSLHSSTEMMMAGRHGKAWIGLHSPEAGTGYVWSDGSPVNYQHWQEGEPNNANHEESCVEFKMYNWDESGSWNDVSCEGYNDWLCQIRAGATPKPPPNNTASDVNKTADGWLQWRGNQYAIKRISKSNEDARYYCQQRHGDLVSISSKEENIFLWKQISRSYGHYYIGLSVDLDGSFWWMDGTSLGVQRWDENQPKADTFDENCVTMTYYMGFWRTSNCGQEHNFICKRGGSPPVNTTVAPTVAPKGGCTISWTQFDSQCYSIIRDRVITWEDARKQCVSSGGNLASIPTRRVQAFLTYKMAELTNGELWIGLNSLKQEGFFWTDGRKRTYTNWGYSKSMRRPGTFYKRWNEEDCVVLSNNAVVGAGKWIVKSCNSTNGFICRRNLDPSLQPQPTEVSIIYVPLRNDSIKAVTKNLTWADAKKACEGDKANLASLRNDWSLAYTELLAMNLKAPLWIGLNKAQTGYFRYVDGWPMTLANWGEREPSRERPCVYLDEDGKWKTAFCNKTMYSVCMQTSEVPPTQSTSFPGVCPEEMSVDYHQTFSWMPFKSNCYLFITEEIEWADAASSCVRHGGALASIEDPSEQEFIKGNVEVFQDSHNSFWIGLYKTHKETLKWLDKTVMDYNNWAPDEPEYDYAGISTSDGLWKTGRRWHDRAYICKTPKVPIEDLGPKPEPHGGDDHKSRIHTNLIVVLTITLISALIVVGFFFYKNFPRPSPVPFENPLYFNSERPQPDVVDTNKLIENAEEITPDPIITL